MPSRDLPANVKSIVAEIETEIGEQDPPVHPPPP